MITIDNKQYRNLEEQVLKNMNDIQDFKDVNSTILDFGIKIIGQADNASEIPDYAETYGDCFLVGTEAPYEYYVWTRNFDDATDEENGQWINIGVFPKAGPQGEKGDKGDIGPQGLQGPQGIQGERGFQGVNGVKGDKGDTGPQGLQGPQGEKGETGTTFSVYGILESTSLLPSPSSLQNTDIAYLIPASGTTITDKQYDLYIQIGETPETRTWNNVGQFNGSVIAQNVIDNQFAGTSANMDQHTINNMFQNQLTSLSTNKQDKLTFDEIPTADSNNPVTSDGIYHNNILYMGYSSRQPSNYEYNMMTVGKCGSDPVLTFGTTYPIQFKITPTGRGGNLSYRTSTVINTWNDWVDFSDKYDTYDAANKAQDNSQLPVFTDMTNVLKSTTLRSCTGTIRSSGTGIKLYYDKNTSYYAIEGRIRFRVNSRTGANPGITFTVDSALCDTFNGTYNFSCMMAFQVSGEGSDTVTQIRDCFLQTLDGTNKIELVLAETFTNVGPGEYSIDVPLVYLRG